MRNPHLEQSSEKVLLEHDTHTNTQRLNDIGQVKN